MSALDSCSIVHFACHGFSDAVFPSRSTLLLHDHEKEPLSVGALAFAVPANAHLAYLSACETAHVAAADLGDEAIHLASAFQLAGYPNVIGTLWQVNDCIAAVIAENVYAGMARPNGTLQTAAAAEVLHEVIRAIRAEKPGLPSLWAAHIHAGG
jgi:CHAT domain-containing protein